MRQLSLSLGRGSTFVAQWLGAPEDHRVPLTPRELQVAAPLLGVPFVVLLERAWGIDPDQLLAELGPLVSGRTLAGEFADLTPTEWDELVQFAAWLRWRRATRPGAGAAPPDGPRPRPAG